MLPNRCGDDAQLVVDMARGDRRALAEAWDRYEKVVRRVIARVMGPDDANEDLAQEVFLALHRGAPSIEDGRALRSYLVSVAMRVAAMELRKRKLRRSVGLTSSGELPEIAVSPADIESRECLRALRRVLERVSDRGRLAFGLRHLQGLGVAEVARVMGVSESTTNRELVRTRSTLALLAQREPALSRYAARLGHGV